MRTRWVTALAAYLVVFSALAFLNRIWPGDRNSPAPASANQVRLATHLQVVSTTSEDQDQPATLALETASRPPRELPKPVRTGLLPNNLQNCLRELEKQIEEARSAGAYARAAVAAKKAHAIRLEAQGPDWHATMDAARLCETLDRISQLSPDKQRAVLEAERALPTGQVSIEDLFASSTAVQDRYRVLREYAGPQARVTLDAAVWADFLGFRNWSGLWALGLSSSGDGVTLMDDPRDNLIILLTKMLHALGGDQGRPPHERRELPDSSVDRSNIPTPTPLLGPALSAHFYEHWLELLAAHQSSDYHRAESLARDMLAMLRKVTLGDIRQAFQLAQPTNLPEDIFRHVTERDLNAFGRDHPIIAKDLSSLGSVRIARFAADSARPLLHESIRIRRLTLGDLHPATVGDILQLACLELLATDIPKARRLLDLSADLYHELGRGADTAYTLPEVADLLGPELAEDLLRGAIVVPQRDAPRLDLPVRDDELLDEAIETERPTASALEREWMDATTNLLQQPESPEALEGVLNLYGEMASDRRADPNHEPPTEAERIFLEAITDPDFHTNTAKQHQMIVEIMKAEQSAPSADGTRNSRQTFPRRSKSPRAPSYAHPLSDTQRTELLESGLTLSAQAKCSAALQRLSIPAQEAVRVFIESDDVEDYFPALIHAAWLLYVGGELDKARETYAFVFSLVCDPPERYSAVGEDATLGLARVYRALGHERDSDWYLTFWRRHFQRTEEQPTPSDVIAFGEPKNVPAAPPTRRLFPAPPRNLDPSAAEVQRWNREHGDWRKNYKPYVEWQQRQLQASQEEASDAARVHAFRRDHLGIASPPPAPFVRAMIPPNGLTITAAELREWHAARDAALHQYRRWEEESADLEQRAQRSARVAESTREQSSEIGETLQLAESMYDQGYFRETSFLCSTTLELLQGSGGVASGRRLQLHELLARSEFAAARYREAQTAYATMLELLKQCDGGSVDRVNVLAHLAWISATLGDDHTTRQRIAETCAAINKYLSDAQAAQVVPPDLERINTALRLLASAAKDHPRLLAEIEQLHRQALQSVSTYFSRSDPNFCSWQWCLSNDGPSWSIYWQRRAHVWSRNRPEDEWVALALAAQEAALATYLTNYGEAHQLKEAKRLFASAIASMRFLRSPKLGATAGEYGWMLATRLQRPLKSIPFLIEAVDFAELAWEASSADRHLKLPFAAGPLAPRDVPKTLTHSFAHLARTDGTPKAIQVVENARGRRLRGLLRHRGRDLLAVAADFVRRTKDAAAREELLRAYDARRSAQRRIETAIAEVREQQVAQPGDATKTRRRIHRYRARLARIDVEYRDAMRQLLELAEEDLYRAGAVRRSTKELSASLKPNEMLLVYDVGEEASMLFVLMPNRPARVFDLRWTDGSAATNKTLAATIRPWFESLCARSAKQSAAPSALDSTEASRDPCELFTTLIPHQLVSDLATASRVLIVPDGPLHYVPFDAMTLPNLEDSALSSGNRLWLDELPPTIYGNSISLLLANRGREAQEQMGWTQTLIAVADPRRGEINAKLASLPRNRQELYQLMEQEGYSWLSVANSPLAPLQAARLEARAAVDLVRRCTGSHDSALLLEGTEATATALFRVVQNPRYLLLSTHGFAAEGAAVLNSGIVLSPAANQETTAHGALRLRDLIDDWAGKLSRTELVVLSACRSGRGQFIAGDGIASLAWGFLYAGADSAAATLWRVDDTATGLLIERLFENLLGQHEGVRIVGERQYANGQPMPKAEALHEAKRWIRTMSEPDWIAHARRLGTLRGPGQPEVLSPTPVSNEGPANPRFWAGFVLLGAAD